ncbi:MAG: Hpt domain-containing protein [Nitrococcus sp.]|nr:Hpt domain-containing protein [Nitrococcus sp.]
MNEQTEFDCSNLSWVRKELDATLRQAAEALDAYAEDAQDSSRLQLCIARVHQVHGILQMLELDGAAMLTQEMEQLGHTLLVEPAIAGDSAQETLMRAVLQLQDYLERVEGGHRDAAILMLPLINELRAARGVATIAESALFAPDLELRCEQARWARAGVDKVVAEARRVRPLYQRGLLAYLRGQNPVTGLKQMDEALLAMDQAGADDRSGTLWWLAGGVIDALDSEELVAHAAMARRLLSQVEHQLKSAMELGVEATAANELLRDLLYYLGHASPVTERIATIQSCYNLPALMAEQARVEQSRERFLGPGRDALGCVARAIHEDLAHIKDTLDLHARGSVRSADDLATTADSLSRIAETLGVVGLLDARRLVQDQAEQVRTLRVDGVLDEQRALQVAEALLFVESALAKLADTRRGPNPDSAGGVVTEESLSESEYRRVSACAISEAITELGYVKVAIVQFIESGEPQCLQGLQRNFAAVRGSLTLVAIERLPDLVAATDRFLRERVLSIDGIASSQTLDELADAITGIEYCLEALRDGHPGGEHGLAVAEASLRRLGCLPAAPESVAAGFATAQTPAEVDESPPALAQGAQQPPLPAVADAAIDYSKKRGRVDPEVPVRSEQIDPEILEIFLEEADEILATLREVFPRWQREADDEDALRTIRRLFHTLKGSGRLAGALLLGELAWSVEKLLNRILDHSIESSLQIFATVAEALSIIPELINELRDGTPPASDIRQAILRASVLSQPARPAALADLDSASAVATAQQSAEGGQEEITRQDEPVLSEHTPFESDTHLPHPTPASSGRQTESALETSAEGPCDAQMDPLLYEIFSKETEDHLGSIEAFLAECQNPVSGQCQIAEGLVRSLHTLAGSARMAQVGPIAEVGHELELLSSKRRAERRLLDACDQDVLERGTRAMRAVVEALGQAGAELPDVSDLVSAIEARRATPPRSAAASGDRHEAESLPQSRVGSPEAWRFEADEPARTPLPQPPTAATAHAHMAQAQPAVDPPSCPARVAIEDEDLVQVFLEEADDILRFLEGSVERWAALPDDETQIAELHRSLHTLKGGARLAGFDGIGHLCHALESVINDVGAHRVPADDTFFDLLHASLDRLTDLLEQARAGERLPASDGLIARIEDLRGAGAPVPAPQGDPNRELVEVFLEEAADILGNTEALLYQWRQQPAGFTSVAALQRVLHTLKGGARMAGFKPIADLSHGLEALLNAVEGGAVDVGEALFDVLESANDHLLTLREAAVSGMPLPAVADLLGNISRLQTGAHAAAAALPRQVQGDDTRAAGEVERRGVDARQRPADQVRVHSQLLDTLVNFAGEVSIYRGRLEQQAVDVGFNLAELGQTVTRLHEQLRTLEIETETQILYRYERDHGAEREDFDPLELDRFSQIQELSRALSESVNDLTNIQAILGNLNRENETLLLQQSRVNSELQDGLMRTRMVPFANLVPRMRRVVRQASEELGKRAQLKVVGAQDEMDRTMLERLIAPLEHMLRNAVAHGIESPSIRRGYGKAEVGTICVTLEREGADISIQVSDDGGGMNLAAIRAKAVARGLMKEDAALSDKEIMQFVLEPGFSTAEQVTQIAGRGVGLDVVNAEIKQLGRSLEIESTLGVGTQFIARLPFTLALNQALLCQVSEEVYAIPLSSIEGVVRLGKDELLDLHASTDSGVYSYAGERYAVRGLAAMVRAGVVRRPLDRPRLPLVLVQAGGQRIALQVDELLGRREIVVKSAGAQISTVPGVLGATILADGRVVFILDIGALIRYGAGANEGLDSERPSATEPVASSRRRPLAMVVDDSITMRKVATRLLQRNDFDVITAKDGVDAVAALQDVVPDAMLLDIEMPRMDGYELATHMRNDERLRSVPIIVITSRTGEKHRLRAMEIGVDHYLGKPYQESELLATLRGLLAKAQARS